MAWIWWAPLAATVLHIVEEFVYPGGFAAWDRSYRPEIRSSITTRLHVIVNGALLLVCLQVALLGMSDDPAAKPVGAAAWLAIGALLFSNAIFHCVGAMRTKSYSPGLVTAVALYVPLAVAGYAHFLRTGMASTGTATLAALVGGSYHLWARFLHRARAARRGPSGPGA